MLQNKRYALILESQGFFKEALEIYEKLLKTYPNDKDIKQSIKTLINRTHFEEIRDINILKLQEFENINEENRYEFEKYLKEIKWT